jgi:DNA-binding NtrC family response regulator
MFAKNPRILIVDDEIPICELIREELTCRGYKCETACSAREALARLAANCFDITLLDISLPEMSGIELLKVIETSYPGTASIMLTAVNDLNVAVDTMKAGAQDYITKPFDFDRLDTAIRAALENRNHTKYHDSDIIQDKTINDIEAIAQGVEARQEILDIHSEKVVQQTVDIARNMGFPEEKIQKWIAARTEIRSKKVKIVVDSIYKLTHNPVSQEN